MAPQFALLLVLLSLLPLVLPHPVRLPTAPCAARVATRTLEGRGAHRVLRTSLHVACRADVFRPRHPGGAHVACGEAPVTRMGSRGYNGNEGETEGGRTDGGEKERPTDGCRAVPELSSCTAASESVGSGGAAGRTRVTILLEQPVPRGLYADPFELERILRPGGKQRESGSGEMRSEGGGVCSDGGRGALRRGQPEGDRAWVVGPVELEQPAPRCEATVALMERDVPVGEGEEEGAGGKVRKGEGDVHAGERKGEKGGVREGEDEVTFSVEFSLPLHSRYPVTMLS
ncbi:unnamed protein product [Closterium sp. Naga37s-1]|nr:unnamed protein product [Closterium sp. Naga37s-1]